MFLTLIFLFVILSIVVGVFWWKERTFLKKKTSEAIRPKLLEELTAEREGVLEKRRKFQEELERAKSRDHSLP